MIALGTFQPSKRSAVRLSITGNASVSSEVARAIV
jgi:hypothetical protein